MVDSTTIPVAGEVKDKFDSERRRAEYEQDTDLTQSEMVELLLSSHRTLEALRDEYGEQMETKIETVHD